MPESTRRMIRINLPSRLASTDARLSYSSDEGRAGVGEVALTTNECKTADRLKNDYWLYVVYNCASTPEVHAIRNPTRLGWQPIVNVEHYRVSPETIWRATHE